MAKADGDAMALGKPPPNDDSALGVFAASILIAGVALFSTLALGVWALVVA